MLFRVHVIAASFALAGGLMLVFAPPAMATAWQQVSSTTASRTEMDIESITKKEGNATAWVQQVHTNPVASKSGAYFVYRTAKMQVRYQCAQRSQAVLAQAYFGENGLEVAAERQAEEARLVFPETPDDRALSVACASDPKKAALALRKTEPDATSAKAAAPAAKPALKPAAAAHGTAKAKPHAK